MAPTALSMDNELHKAAYRGDAAEVRRLIEEAGADVTAPEGRDNETALHVAARHGRKKACRILIEAGSNVAATEFQGRTPLHLATVVGYDKIVRILLKAGATCNIADDWGRTPLHEAAHWGHEKAAAILLQSGANPELLDHVDGEAPLHMATRHGHEETMRTLIIAHADPEAIYGRHHSTALHRCHYLVYDLGMDEARTITHVLLERGTALQAALNHWCLGSR